MLNRDEFKLVFKLSAAQRMVLVKMGHGMSTKEIAGNTRSTKTIDTHMIACRKKLGLLDTLKLRVYAIRYVIWCECTANDPYL